MYNTLTVVELKKLAKIKGLAGYSRLKKAELITLLETGVSKKSDEKSVKKSAKKSAKRDRYIGKVILVSFPNTKNPRYRWIVRKREDGRYIVRAPKINVAIRDLNLKREKDFGKEVLLPVGCKLKI